MSDRRLTLVLTFLVLMNTAVGRVLGAGGRQPFEDRRHASEVFGVERNYRIFLPPEYEASHKHYPVIYYFHGHSDRYTLEHYDNGTGTVPDIAEFVRNHDVLVVAVDGYVAEHYTGFYGGTPWDVREGGGDYDFGEYFLELVEHIDSTFRTQTDRRHRATSGLSMGGFMSLYLSARYPELIGSASAFNPGPEFYVGEKGRRMLWRPKDHVSSHAGRWVRLIRASGDYISQYHEETRLAYARAARVKFEFRQDEFHRHAATSIGETFAFHMRAFQDPTLNNFAEEWAYSSPFSRFEVRGYQVQVSGSEKAMVYLNDVRQGGFRLTTRRWAPDGPAVAEHRIEITTAPNYRAGKSYLLLDYDLHTGEISKREVLADERGSLQISIDGSGHEIGIVGPGTGAQAPVLLPVSERERLYVLPREERGLPIRLFNPRGEALENVRVELTTDYPTVQILRGTLEIDRIEPGAIADLSEELASRFFAGGGYFAPVRLMLKLTYDGWHERTEEIDVLIAPEDLPEPAEILVFDGRTLTLPVFRQKGNQGGGASVERQVTEGRGDGDGVFEPGEEATLWVRLKQGLDPFDQGNWYRCKVRSESPWIREVGDIQEEKQLEWTGAKNRSSLLRLDPQTPSSKRIPLILENESWSYEFTPDVRYGDEPLYQAFQKHAFHLHRYELVIQ
ncbi:MAG: hypothetical protein JSU96_12195 [Acidobacteriota bacterium]|nr:MAG: hypothetical protein JSU96_12195 [Acidobacteriota bacterium]